MVLRIDYHTSIRQDISVFDIGVNSLMIKCDNIDRTIKFFYVSADINNRKAVMAIFDTNEKDFGLYFSTD